MKNALVILTMILGTSAFAGTGSGSMSCNFSDQVVALYTWFHSNADDYSNVTVFVQSNDGEQAFKQYNQTGAALDALEVTTETGTKIKVSADLSKGCTIDLDLNKRLSK